MGIFISVYYFAIYFSFFPHAWMDGFWLGLLVVWGRGWGYTIRDIRCVVNEEWGDCIRNIHVGFIFAMKCNAMNTMGFDGGLAGFALLFWWEIL